MARALAILADPELPDPDAWIGKMLWVRDRSAAPVMVLLQLWPRVCDDFEAALAEVKGKGDDVRGPVGVEKIRTAMGDGVRLVVTRELDDDGVSEIAMTVTYAWRPEWSDGGTEADVLLEATGTPGEIAAMAGDLERLAAGLRLMTPQEAGLE